MVLGLREENRLNLFQNKIVNEIFGPNRDKDVEWRKLHDGDLRYSYLHLEWVKIGML